MNAIKFLYYILIMLVLSPKYGSLIDLVLLKKQKAKTKEQLINHRLTIDLTSCKNIKEAYLAFLDNKDKYVIGYKPKDRYEINDFVYSLGEIDTLDVSWIDVSHLETLASCFLHCSVKHIIRLEKWDVSKVKGMHHMFANCENLESVGDISEWDVSNVNDLSHMFALCENLESIGDISRWNVNKVLNMFNMFNGCKKLKSVGNLERWSLPSLIVIDNMFFNSAIKHLPSWYIQ